MNLLPWTILDSRPLDISPWLRVETQRVRLPDGRELSEFVLRQTRESCLIVARLPDGRYPLVKQYKHGLGRVVREFPAGYLDGEETPLACAKRELREETGYAATEWTRLGILAREPHYSATVMHVWRAAGLQVAGDLAPDESESLQLEFFSADEIVQLLAEGEMCSVYCAAAWGLVNL